MEFLQANPAWITSAMFLLTFGESIVILGLFIPASLVMPGIGALAAAVGIGPVEIMFYASLGMIIGDTVSYAIGLMIGTRIETWIPNQYQKQLHQAKQFMNKYGILSVALGRFLGPLRCLVPMTAGSLGMRFTIFCTCLDRLIRFIRIFLGRSVYRKFLNWYGYNFCYYLCLLNMERPFWSNETS